jgi:hypothetical protein
MPVLQAWTDGPVCTTHTPCVQVGCPSTPAIQSDGARSLHWRATRLITTHINIDAALAPTRLPYMLHWTAHRDRATASGTP